MSPTVKRALYRSVVGKLAAFGVPGRDIKIVLVEVPLENVGLCGGQAASDIDLGYDLNI